MKFTIGLALALLCASAHAQQWKAGSASGAWQSDATIATGGTVSALSGTAPYNSHRWGTFTLNAPVTNGQCTVTLSFKEPWAGPGKRVFHIDIEGKRVETNFDVAALAGANPLVRNYTGVTVADGKLTVAFIDGGPDDPMYSGLTANCVASVPNPPPNPPPPTGGVGTLTWSWDAPITNSDGTPLTDLAGFNLYFGPSAVTLSTKVNISNPGVRTYLQTGLAPGTYFGAMAAYNTAGIEGQHSNPASGTVAGTPPPPVCTTPKPIDDGTKRTQTCVAPAIGTWQQTLTYPAVAFPQCWGMGEWLPDTAPAGACGTPPPPPVDCVVSAYSAWMASGEWTPAACPSSAMQTRTETRTRTVLTPASNGGAACPALTESRTATQTCTPPVVVTWKVKAISAGTRPATELVRNATDTGWVLGYKLGDIAVGKPCDAVKQYGSSTTEYHKVSEADVTLLSPTYKGRTLVAVCGK